MQLRLQRIGAWCGIAMIVLFSAFFSGIARLFPPLSPTSSAEEITQFFIDHKIWIRIGCAGSLLFICLAFPFLSTLCLRIRRIEGQWGMLSITQVFAATFFVPGLLFPFLMLSAAAFRPESRSPEITQALDDLFWLMFIGVAGTIVVQAVVLAVAAFVDTTDPPTFPRWYGYFNLWTATLSLPGCMTVVFNDGPLAWNGVFSFYLPGVALFGWMVVTAIVLLRSISAEVAAEAPLATAT